MGINIFEIIGPIMVGPSSSHTAGAVKIGYVSQKLLGEPISKAEILLSGSFLATGKGHGTNYALAAGLLGMHEDDTRIPDSIEIAKKNGIKLIFGKAKLKNVHPNSVQLNLTGNSGRYLEIIGESTGGSVINIASIDSLKTNFSGDNPTLIVHNQDMPGHIAEVTGMLSKKNINIASMKLDRTYKGGDAVMILELDQEIPQEIISWLTKLKGVNKVTYYSLKESFNV